MRGRILIVEDNAPLRAGLLDLLLGHGFEAEAAADTDALAECLDGVAYDVAIVNPCMGAPDGRDMLAWVRERAPGALPLVLPPAVSEDAPGAVDEQAFDILWKPLEEEARFLRQIAQAMGHKLLCDERDRLLRALQAKNIELENRLGQLELAHSILQSQAVAIQVDLSRAMRIQQGLLPRESPFADRISMAAAYHPMAKVGGDLYDVFRLDAARMGCYIADTSGHGVSSAMLTIFLKHAVQGLVWDGPRADAAPCEGQVRSPGRLLGALNETILSEAFGEGIFVSMTYLVLDVDTGVVTYSSAGHPPMFVRRTNGSLERLHRPAPVLGVNPRVAYTESEIALQPGELLILHTDGITDARNTEGDSFGEGRFTDAIQQADPHVDAIVGHLERVQAAFCDGSPRVDDATVVVLGMEPQRVPPQTADEMAAPLGHSTTRSVKVLTSRRNGHVFIGIAGTGSWRESQQVFDLCRQTDVRTVTLDLHECTHLDSTFLGVLHNIVTTVGNEPGKRIEIQNVPRDLLKTMSELGLTSVLMHFRPEPAALPGDMVPVEGGAPAGEELGRLLLWAHESLVEADPSNADRFAAVLQVLHDRATGVNREAKKD